ncbi:VanZ family protein [Amnibacterium kyonggiense]|uniref:Glycopeptide antibiotics resistance protein n=1 Tax=Amnibacterium kyonggiense TaxID=595671 RepID=A0A4V6Q117_9MICO|nr:VanZ family protein [Amnibacterium kyonggiense]TDS80894.1 glycopeptide antibiotics resistance protein [Amnibacterium kyonggiense]
MLRNAVIALILGVPLSVLLLVPVAAVLYRREGRLAPTAIAQLLAGAVYFCALWAYTLLPTPPARELTRCAVPQLHPFAFVGDVLRFGVGSPSALLHNPALLQVVLNIALFVPFGVGVRLLLHRGVLVALLIGFLGSLLIEVTQLTGIYGIYSCAYRLFDVDDLIANTTGAVLGSLAVVGLARPRRAQRTALDPVPVRLGRRLLGMFADVVVIGFVQFVLSALWAVCTTFGGGPAAADLPVVQQLATWGVPAALELVLVLRTGRTAGEALVLITPGAPEGGRWRQALFGVVGYCLLGPVGALQGMFVVVTLIAAIATKDRRGLSRAVSGGRIVALAGRRRGTPSADLAEVAGRSH